MKRVRKYLFIIILLGIAIFIYTQWGKWFYNPTEQPYTTPQAPHHIALTLSPSPTGRMITWQCDTMVQEAYVEYYAHDTLPDSKPTLLQAEALSESYRSEGGMSVFYRAIIPQVVPGKYSYRIIHPNTQSQWYDFAVNPTDGRMQFIYIGDIQDTINGTTHIITENIKRRHPDVDLYLLGGDIIHRPHEQHWDEFFTGAAPYITSHPTVAVNGNHEYLKGINGRCERRFPLHFAYFLDNFNRHEYCFSVLQYENAELFLMDSNRDILGLLSQRNMLEEALKQSRAKWKILMLHHPPYSIKGDMNNIHLKAMLSSILQQYGVQLVLCGHEHGYARIHPHDKTTPAYIISHCSPKVYEHDNTHCAEVYLTGDRYYQHIDIDNNTMIVTTYTANGEVVDALEIEL